MLIFRSCVMPKEKRKWRNDGAGAVVIAETRHRPMPTT
jgi:hypothetical protein